MNAHEFALAPVAYQFAAAAPFAQTASIGHDALEHAVGLRLLWSRDPHASRRAEAHRPRAGIRINSSKAPSSLSFLGRLSTVDISLT
jgi:hypothetical protein